MTAEKSIDRPAAPSEGGGEGPRNRAHDIRKYFNYYFEKRGFTSDTAVGAVSDTALAAAALARGPGRGPAIFIQGIMPRSGTVYAGELLRRHPDLAAFPHQLWEFPALTLTGRVNAMQQLFLDGYRLNHGKLDAGAFLPVVGGGLMAYLHSATPAEQRVLVKMPSVQYLSHFYAMFPHENLLVLVRDGRDVVHSTLRTWSRLNFIQVCLRWHRSAQAVIAHDAAMMSRKQPGYWLARYEDALYEPETFINQACRHFGLDDGRYPYDEIADIRVIGSSKLEGGQVTWRHLTAPDAFRPTGYWAKWSPLKKRIFKVIAGRSLMALGYADDQDW